MLTGNARFCFQTWNKQDVESAAPNLKYVILGARARRITTSTTLCLLIMSLLVMSIGVIGGVYVYRQFTRQQFQRFHGWCNIPYGNVKSSGNKDYQGHQESLFADSNLFERLSNIRDNGDRPMFYMQNNGRNSFRQEFELDPENDLEKIVVPDFGRARKGKFIHDFTTNKTGIIDYLQGRCFIMPLNRQRVYPPRRMSDIINQMLNGSYDVDTEVVRETMTVVLPPISDFRDIGQFIEQLCKPLKTYMLKKRDDPIVKRSASINSVFAEFAGKKISELEIDTSPAEEYEKSELSKA
ncbi:UNVERIFIED_CONTAM: hypothetical protein PYX00_006212 [Menopon gallinae]|uniref:Integral membrane protein 2 n=1 Tax=Menopon gallinae TaxID=328185 RepID=A0AAW2HU84_9NEOP